jgi:hypothetical protein
MSLPLQWHPLFFDLILGNQYPKAPRLLVDIVFDSSLLQTAVIPL